MNELIAFSTIELAATQKHLIDWFSQKKTDAETQLKEIEENIAIAKKNKWRQSGLKSVELRIRKLVTYYEKAKAAVEAGFLLIPNFPLNVFAIRVSRENPVPGGTYNTWDRHAQKTDSPKIGAGQNVDVSPEVSQTKVVRKHDAGKEPEYGWWSTAENFQEVSFPVMLAHPTILKKIASALALKIFDEVGLVGQSARQDPIVCGRIKFKQGYQEKNLTFFIAWWVRMEDL